MSDQLSSWMTNPNQRFSKNVQQQQIVSDGSSTGVSVKLTGSIADIGVKFELCSRVNVDECMEGIKLEVQTAQQQLNGNTDPAGLQPY